MPLSNKEALLQRHQANTLLNMPSPPPMMRSETDLSADEFAAPLDERIIASTVEALEGGQTHYVDVPGIAPLREAIAETLNAAVGAVFSKANIIVTAGMQEARFLTLQMIGDLHGRVAAPSVVHPGVLKALGVRALQLDRISVVDERGLPTVDAIRAALEAGARLLYLESPSRLTGAAYSADEVATLAALLAESEAGVIWDQGLSSWVPVKTFASLAAHRAIDGRVAVIGEAYPGIGLASWFIGYIAAPEAWVAPMQSQKQIMAICTSTASQYAALEASKLFPEARPARLAALVELRQKLVELAPRAGLKPIEGDAANVLALRAIDGDGARKLAALREAGFALADGAEFGAPGVLRLSVTLGDTALKALQALA
ncbi:MAG: aminotransferase class I/II-fold pyridoxal phosphate-dependent enzyme [Aggregatilineales bacterium]